MKKLCLFLLVALAGPTNTELFSQPVVDIVFITTPDGDTETECYTVAEETIDYSQLAEWYLPVASGTEVWAETPRGEVVQLLATKENTELLVREYGTGSYVFYFADQTTWYRYLLTVE